jgi:hypothetical protein
MEAGMKPKIGHTEFGLITVGGESFDYDILIRLDGQVKKRKKKLSKEVYGTSHIVSLAEAMDIYERGAEQLVVGSGQSGMLRCSEEALGFFKEKGCQVDVKPTPQAIQTWNAAKGAVIGMFHVTC